jgi:hypothetical protein
MSLCQSLRQYVFVHAAIVEGALLLVDEERESESGDRHLRPTALSFVDRVARPNVNDAINASQSTSPSKGKRVASPTEILKEDKSGRVALSKRPSIKRSGHSASRILPETASLPNDQTMPAVGMISPVRLSSDL